MKKLLLLLSILTFSFGAFAAGADLCDDERDDSIDKNVCTAQMVADAVDGDPCFGKNEGDEQGSTIE